MAGALDQVLQEQIVGALFTIAQVDLHAIKLEPRLLPDVDAGRFLFLAFYIRIHVTPKIKSFTAKAQARQGKQNNQKAMTQRTQR